MGKVVVSALLALVAGSVIVAGVHLGRRSQESWKAVQKLTADVAVLRNDLNEAREARSLLGERLSSLESDLQDLVSARTRAGPGVASPVSAGDGVASPAPAAVVVPEDIRAYVFAAMEEERKLREDERQQQREQMQQRLEERRKEIAALREGPYERHNLKVNSMGKVLGLDDAQKQAYFELSKQYSEKLDEARRKLFAAAAAQAGATADGTSPGGAPQDGANRGRGRGRESWGQARELSDSLQKEYAAAVETILTPAQLETYQQLSPQSQSFQSLDAVAAPGESGGFADRFLGGAAFGGAQGGPGGMRGGTRGQRGGGAGGR